MESIAKRSKPSHPGCSPKWAEGKVWIKGAIRVTSFCQAWGLFLSRWGLHLLWETSHITMVSGLSSFSSSHFLPSTRTLPMHILLQPASDTFIINSCYCLFLAFFSLLILPHYASLIFFSSVAKKCPNILNSFLEYSLQPFFSTRKLVSLYPMKWNLAVPGEVGGLVDGLKTSFAVSHAWIRIWTVS